MPGKCTGPKVGAIHVDAPEFVQTIGRIGNGVEVLREAGRGDEVVDFAVVGQDLVETGFDRLRVGNVGKVGRDFRIAVK